MKYINKYYYLLIITIMLACLCLPGMGIAGPSGDNSPQQTTDNPAVSQSKKQNSKSDDISFGNYLSGRFAATSGDSSMGIKFLRESLKQDPTNTDIMLNLYRALISAGNIEEAVPLARKLNDARLTDEDSEFPPQLALMLDAVRQGHYIDADKYLQAVPKAGFNSLLVPLLQAWLNLGNGKVKAPLDAKDIMPGGRMLLSYIYLNAGFIDELAGFDAEALQEYKTAVKETRLESLRAAEALANYYIRKGKKDKFSQFTTSYAATHGETIIDDEIYTAKPPLPLVSNANEGIAEALYTVASIFHGIRSPSEEITTLRMALYLRPDFPAAGFLLGNAYELSHNFQNAIKSYKTIGSESPYYIQAQIMTAYDESELGDKDTALAHLDKIAASNPHNISALLAKGDILRTSNKFDQAIAAYDSAIARVKIIQKPDWIAYFSRGVCYDRINQFDKTEADMKRALEISPNEPDVLNYLGYSWLTKHHNVQQATKMIEEAYDERPEDAQIIDSMGYALYVGGDFTSAQEYFEQALERIPDDPTINEHLGDTYWQLGHKVEASYQWQRALDNKPDEENKKVLLKKLASGIAFITPSTAENKKPKPTEVQ